MTPLVFLFALTAEPLPPLAIYPRGNLQVEVIAPLPATVAKSLPALIPSARGEALLVFSLVDAKSSKPGPAVFGKYELKQGRLHFRPRYTLSHGHRYRATLTLPDKNPQSADYVVPARKPTTPPKVVAIYPTTSKLPENVLKFYIYFSQPMREGRAIFDQIRLLDAAGKPIRVPWRRTELWTANAKRFTLWFHPGRVKQGLRLRQELGPILHPGRKYTLEISPSLLDAHGQALGKAYRKHFETLAADHQRPLPDSWKIQPPTAGTTEPLRVSFPEPLDRELLKRFITLKDTNGNDVKGRLEVGHEERSLAFHPAQAWATGIHFLRVAPWLEDLAGNTPERVFDTDLTKPPPPPARLTRTFHPVAAGSKASN